MQQPERAWAMTSGEVLKGLAVERGTGLSTEEVHRRRKRFGPNALRVRERESPLVILGRQFKSLIIGILAAAAVLSFMIGEPVQGIAIGVAVVINAAIGFVTELRAVRSMEALRELSRTSARTRRDGTENVIAAGELVPGDIVVFEGGDVVSADVRVLEANRLEANESTLTGESTPVIKRTDPDDDDAPLADRASMLWKGTVVTRGSGEGVVVSTGEATELGRVSTLVGEVEDETTPIEQRLSRLGGRLLWVTLIVAVAVAGAGALAGRDILLMLETSIALAVAAIPEGLPVVATIALARGMWRMAQKNALINRLAAVETLGATDVVFSDKTGTLTENRMTASVVLLASGEFDISREREGAENDESLREVLRLGVLSNNATLECDGEGGTGDPIEIALLSAGRAYGIERGELLESMPEQREVAFDPEVKMMATFHSAEDGLLVAVKGAPESVIECATNVRSREGAAPLDDDAREEWLRDTESLAGRGLRVLAFARKTARAVGEEAFSDLTLVGLVGFEDPPLDEAEESVGSLRELGVRVVMVTGDQPATARAIASDVGISDEPDVVMGSELPHPDEATDAQEERLRSADVFARVTPRQKLDLIELYQDAGSVVGMTGDGVNDAPALRKADIGIAMGRRGTEVAREAADMILQDDRLSTVVAAVQQGRVIFDNIRKFLVYLLPCHVSEVTAVTVAAVADAPLPLLPLQILYLNIVTDVFPALALGVGEGDRHAMRRSPRAKTEPLLTRRHWSGVGIIGGMMGLGVLLSLFLAARVLGFPEGQAVSIAFLTQGFGSLWHVLNVRERGSGFFKNDVVRNPFVWGALAICTGLLLATVHVPLLSEVLRVQNPGRTGWLVVMGVSLAPWTLIQFYKSLRSAPSGDEGV